MCVLYIVLTVLIVARVYDNVVLTVSSVGRVGHVMDVVMIRVLNVGSVWWWCVSEWFAGESRWWEWVAVLTLCYLCQLLGAVMFWMSL